MIAVAILYVNIEKIEPLLLNLLYLYPLFHDTYMTALQRISLWNGMVFVL